MAIRTHYPQWRYIQKAGCGCSTPSTEVITNCLNASAEPVVQGIETAMAPVGCVRDAVTGEIVGKVLLCKTISDEEGATATFEHVASMYDGTTVYPYTGTIDDCAEACGDVLPSGIQNSW